MCTQISNREGFIAAGMDLEHCVISVKLGTYLGNFGNFGNFGNISV